MWLRRAFPRKRHSFHIHIQAANRNSIARFNTTYQTRKYTPLQAINYLRPASPTRRTLQYHSAHTTATMSAIINFYDPSVNAPFDRYEEQSTLVEAITWSDRTLEYRHDYIQHWFPLPEPSPVNPEAPVITKETRDAFLSRSELRDNLRRAWLRMQVTTAR